MMRRIVLMLVVTLVAGLVCATNVAVTAVDTTLADGFAVSGSVNLDYAPIDAGRVSLEVNGRELLSATDAGTLAWMSERPGNYVLAHRAGGAVFSRKVVRPGSEGAKELEIGWLDGPVSNCFPNCYAQVTNVVIGPSVTHVPEGAFAGCGGLASVTIPSSVTGLDDGAFNNCTGLTNVVFDGNAPATGRSVFDYVGAGCTATVYGGTTGWDEDGDEMWNGLVLVWRDHSSESIPDLGENPTAEQVAAALAGSADATLAAHIADGASYNAYRAWAETVKGVDGQAAGTQAVKASQTAWLSFALGCETLLADAPEALTVEAFEPTVEGDRFAFTVDVKDVTVGSAATAENLKQVFGVEGGASLEELSAENVNLTFGTPEDGKVKFTAGPKDPTLPAFFMKVKLTP